MHFSFLLWDTSYYHDQITEVTRCRHLPVGVYASFLIALSAGSGKLYMSLYAPVTGKTGDCCSARFFPFTGSAPLSFYMLPHR